ncbi:MAG: MATE family efflux transporter [Clostridia bacterium]|nr:MATE family efflux transporter [Clostridia bacterium]
MQKNATFTQGKIFAPLIKFVFPILGALILQAMYGAVDLLVVGQFGVPSDISAVSTGSQLMHTITFVITALASAATIMLGQAIGAKENEKVGNIIGNAICMFAVIAAAVTAVVPLLAPQLSSLMNAPSDAFDQTVKYIAVCAGGALFIVAYNLLGSIFRGLGDSKTPLLAVTIACVANIVLDLLFVAVFKLAAMGAALATVIAQAISVIICLFIIKKRGLPYPFSRKNIRFNGPLLGRTLRLGAPIAFQELLVSISFLVLLAIVNRLDVIVSAGVGVAEKLCAFIMLVPSAFMQSLAAFVAQNVGANEYGRAKKALLYGMASSLILGVVMAWAGFFHGDILCRIFARDNEVILAGAQYLKAYAIDTLLVSFLFCFLGYFNGCGSTTFVMIQGIVGAFCIRIPVAYLFSKAEPVSLFNIGLATPCSTVVQIIMCCVYFVLLSKKFARRRNEISLS